MLNKNSNYNNKTDKYVKRRYSQALENDNLNEPTRKIRRIKKNKLDNDLETLSFTEEVNSHSAEFQDFLKYFMIPSNMYKTLALRHKTNPIILKRNLTYLAKNKSDNQKSNLRTIADHLSTVRFHDENLALMKGKLPFKPTFPNYPNKVVFKFDQFVDSKSEKDWKTIEAIIYLDIIHFYRDNRKNKDSFIVNRVISNQKIKCSEDNKADHKFHIIDIASVMQSASCYRVYKSVFHFKILAKEKKLSCKEKDDKRSDIYPVTYEAMMPLFNNTCNRNLRSLNFFVQSGKYQIYMDVTNMEKCDDSFFNGTTKIVYNNNNNNNSNENGLDSNNQLDCQWYRIDDPQHKIVNKNKVKILFEIDNEETLKAKNKPMQTRNKSLPPIIKMSPYKIGGGWNMSSSDVVDNDCVKDLRLSSIKLKEKEKIDVNIAYKFVVKEKIVQWTQTKHLTCPWCQLNFHLFTDLFDTFQKLLSHLNNWHSKLIFTCKKLKSRASFNQALEGNFITIDVKLNEVSPNDLDFGHMLSNDFPIRRMPLTELIFSKYQKPVVKKIQHKNHNRKYSHTWSAINLKPVEFDIDSESEENKQWLFDQYYRKVEEFSDLNHIEKKVIQMWNKELLSYGVYVSDIQIEHLVKNFIERIIEKENQLKEVKSMRNTFMLHLMNLIDFGVLSSATMLQCMKRLDEAFDKI
uniref:Polycomb protein SUZ12-1 n=1 Tax=Dugesia japonica TaxID=6161 RepID=A0A481NVF5_DUGJA|nr:polycomb protein SUZ12-1 [Dugesia japonica]